MSDNNLMQVMYDYLDKIFIGDADGKKSCVLQLLPLAIAINKKDYENPISRNNPLGFKNSAENFSQLVNEAPEAKTKFSSKGKLEDVYEYILGSAVATEETPIDEAAKKRYDDAHKLLYIDIDNTKKEDLDDDFDDGFDDDFNDNFDDGLTDRHIGYNKALMNYDKKINERTIDFINADHLTSRGQQIWAVKKSEHDRVIKMAYNKLLNYKDIKNALDIVNTSFPEGVRGLLSREKERFSSTAKTSDTGNNWHMSLAFPSNWYENDKMYISISMDSSTLKDQKSSKCLSAGGETSMQMGVFSGSASGGYTKNEKKESKNVAVTGIKMDIASVRIERPWLNETLLSLGGWKLGSKAETVSDGTFPSDNDCLMPMIPKYMLIVKNVTLLGEFGSDVKSTVDESITAKTSVGIGPFRISGGMSSDKSDDVSEVKFENNSITIKHPQIIGFISSITSKSPKNG